MYTVSSAEVYKVRRIGKCRVLKTVQKLSVESFTLHTLNKRYIGDTDKATSQAFQLLKRPQGIVTTWQHGDSALLYSQIAAVNNV